MLFLSYGFWLFFVAVAIVYYAVPATLARAALVVASFLFYGMWNPWFVVLLLGCILFNYATGLGIEKYRNGPGRLILILAVTADLSLLAVFKYYGFLMVSAAALLGRAPGAFQAWHIVLPVAISFYTFEAISYNVDVYRRHLPAERDIIDFSLFISFFPHLAAGPIIRPAHFFPQLRQRHIPSEAEIGWGGVQIVKGLLKKAVFADNFALIANSYFNEQVGHAGLVGAWVGILAFSLQIYFDFSGYTDVARGCAMLLGYRFPPNFERPYLAADIAEFWQRWHISLSTWLRDYLYIPLGGNRRGVKRTYFNLMFTMALGGLWHGASWNFVAWGIFHGGLLVSHRAWRKMRGVREGGAVSRAAGISLTFVLVTLGWVTFRAPDFSTTLRVFGDLFFGGTRPHAVVPAQMVWLIVACGAWLLLDRNRRLQSWIVSGQSVLATLKTAGAFAACLLVMELFAPVNASVPFIYFRF